MLCRNTEYSENPDYRQIGDHLRSLGNSSGATKRRRSSGAEPRRDCIVAAPSCANSAGKRAKKIVGKRGDKQGSPGVMDLTSGDEVEDNKETKKKVLKAKNCSSTSLSPAQAIVQEVGTRSSSRNNKEKALEPSEVLLDDSKLYLHILSGPHEGEVITLPPICESSERPRRRQKYEGHQVFFGKLREGKDEKDCICLEKDEYVSDRSVSDRISPILFF